MHTLNIFTLSNDMYLHSSHSHMTRTFTAVTPHAKVKSRNVIAADVVVVRLHAQEDVFLHAVDVVRALADHLGQ